jgi:hypothetical protein
MKIFKERDIYFKVDLVFLFLLIKKIKIKIKRKKVLGAQIKLKLFFVVLVFNLKKT